MSIPALEDLSRRLFEILRDEILGIGGDFLPDSNLIEAGLDSLGVTQLMLSIEEYTGVWIDESLLTPENLESAESLASLVHGQLSVI
ncbi:MAG: phosphopantetheine-binding protein [Myxococcota bacterium]|jgi:acyl carrier protein